MAVRRPRFIFECFHLLQPCLLPSHSQYFLFYYRILIILIASPGNHDTILFSLLSLLCLAVSLPFLSLYLILYSLCAL